MATRCDAYVDTSAFIALASDSDMHHDLFTRLFADPPSLVMTGRRRCGYRLRLFLELRRYYVLERDL